MEPRTTNIGQTDRWAIHPYKAHVGDESGDEVEEEEVEDMVEVEELVDEEEDEEITST